MGIAGIGEDLSIMPITPIEKFSVAERFNIMVEVKKPLVRCMSRWSPSPVIDPVNTVGLLKRLEIYVVFIDPDQYLRSISLFINVPFGLAMSKFPFVRL